MGTIRRFDLNEIKDKYNTKVFVETGTMYGDGVKYAQDYNFEKIISIEIEPAIHQTATENFKNHDNVEILLGDSSKVLPDRLESITDNALFWLDAHFPGADAGLVSYESCKQMEYDTRVPLEAELTAIAKRVKTYKDVIIADDLWLYEEGSFGGGNMNDHARQHNQNITKEEIVGKDATFAYNLFEETHDIKKYYPDQGYLVFLPKL